MLPSINILSSFQIISIVISFTVFTIPNYYNLLFFLDLVIDQGKVQKKEELQPGKEIQGAGGHLSP